ncbi:MAG: hypothetical protein KKF65_06350, partial [Nanoarchaeota archaeon]|nr:hypothetical protein [Nanoarchaeota archaeon]
IYGPKGTKKRVQHLLDSVVFDGSNVDLKVVELNPNSVEVFKKTKDYTIQCAPMDHTTSCIAYSFVENDLRKINLAKAKKYGLKEGPELGKLQDGKSIVVNGKKIIPDDVSSLKKGRKLTFIFDTLPTQTCFDIANNSDVLVSEAVYMSDMKDNSEKYKHMTTQDAALIANKANVKRLIITHFSQRYKTLEKLEEEIQTYFANSSCAHDFMKVKF